MLQVNPLDGMAAGRLYRSLSAIRNTSTVAYCYDRRSCCRESHREQTTSLSVLRHPTGLQSDAIPCALNGCPSIFSSYYAPYWDEVDRKSTRLNSSHSSI